MKKIEEQLNHVRLEELKAELHSFVEAMATAIDERTPYNGTHTRKVAEYAVMLAKKLNEKYALGETTEFFDEERLDKLTLAALLHDIGKMVVSGSIMNRATRLDRDREALEERFKLLFCYYEIDYLKGKISKEAYDTACQELQEILEFINEIDNADILSEDAYDRVQKLSEKYYQKENGQKIFYITEQERKYLSIRRGTLTEEDREHMENHVLMTSKILSKVRFSKYYSKVPKWAGEHHEFLDGSGYPKGLTAKDIDVETRILTISDIYDALTSPDRPYKAPMTREKSLKILHDMAEKGKLDKQLVGWLQEAVMC